MTPYRNNKLLAAAKGQQCQLQIPGVCQGGTETTVACHSPLCEDRNGTKAPDFSIAFGCMACHDVLDRRKRAGAQYLTEDDQRYYFHRGLLRTLANIFDRGILKC